MSDTKESDRYFKKCSGCNVVWSSREAFLDDPKIEGIGYQSFDRQLDHGSFLFNHRSCRTTPSIKIENFLDYYEGSENTQNVSGADECPAYCVDKDKLESCLEQCENTYTYEILKELSKRSKMDK